MTDRPRMRMAFDIPILHPIRKGKTNSPRSVLLGLFS